MKKLFYLVMLGSLVGLLVLSCGQKSNPVQATLSDQIAGSSLAKAEVFNTKERYDLELTEFVPCAAEGAGEYVYVSGPVQIVFHITIDAHGGFHAIINGNFMALSGLGLTTGDKYVAASAFSEIDNNLSGDVEEEGSFVFNELLVGPGVTFKMSSTYHITVHADGTVTGYVDNLEEECK